MIAPASAIQAELDRMRLLRSRCPRDDCVPMKSMSGRKKARYECRICPHISKNKDEKWAHARTHIPTEKQLRCSQCSFVTENTSHMKYHLMNHAGNKPFKCDKCDYSCVCKSLLNSHMKSHSNAYDHHCADCDYETKYSNSLTLHCKRFGHRREIVDLAGSPSPDFSLPPLNTPWQAHVQSLRRTSQSTTPLTIPTVSRTLLPLSNTPLSTHSSPTPSCSSSTAPIPAPLPTPVVPLSTHNAPIDSLRVLTDSLTPTTSVYSDVLRPSPSICSLSISPSTSAMPSSTPIPTAADPSQRLGNATSFAAPQQQDTSGGSALPSFDVFASAQLLAILSQQQEQAQLREAYLAHLSGMVRSFSAELFQLECYHCKIAFPTVQLYCTHMSFHNPVNPMICSRCHFVCANPLAFNLHLLQAAHQ